MNPTRTIQVTCLVITLIGPTVGWAVEQRSDGISLDRQLSALRRRTVTLVQNSLATCMRSRGFRFANEPAADDPALALPEREWLRRFGYGVTTRDAAGEEDRAATGMSRQERYVASLSDERRAAYEAALSGQGAVNEADAAAQTCSDISAALLADIDRLMGRYDDDREAFYERLAQDPRIGGSQTRWAQCMAERGHAYEAPPAIMADLQQRRQAQMHDPDQLAALRETEMAIAAADDACRAEAVDGTMREVIAEYRPEYAVGSRRLLNEARAAVALARARWRADRTRMAAKASAPTAGERSTLKVLLSQGIARRSELLVQVAAQAGIRVTGTVLSDHSLDIAPRELELADALRVVLGTQSYTLTYDDKGTPKALQLIGSSVAGSTPAARGEPVAIGSVVGTADSSLGVDRPALVAPAARETAVATGVPAEVLGTSLQVGAAIEALNDGDFRSLGRELMRDGEPSALSRMLSDVFGDAAPDVLQEIAANSTSRGMRRLATEALSERGIPVVTPPDGTPEDAFDPEQTAAPNLATEMLAAAVDSLPAPNDPAMIGQLGPGRVKVIDTTRADEPAQ